MKFRELTIRKDPDCPACGEHPTLDGLLDYDQFCGLRVGELPAAEPDPQWEVDPRTLRARLAQGEQIVLLDVRNPEEQQISRIAGSRLTPRGSRPGGRLSWMPPASPGPRSLQAVTANPLRAALRVAFQPPGR